MSSLSSWIPPHPGLLPKWLLFVSGVSIINAFSNFASPAAARRIYAYTATPVTDQAARLFGTWTMISGIIRFYGAYHITDPAIYQMTLWTFVVALAHFGLETLVWKTTGPRTAAVSTYVVAFGTVVWMVWGREDYVN